MKKWHVCFPFLFTFDLENKIIALIVRTSNSGIIEFPIHIRPYNKLTLYTTRP